MATPDRAGIADHAAASGNRRESRLVRRCDATAIHQAIRSMAAALLRLLLLQLSTEGTSLVRDGAPVDDTRRNYHSNVFQKSYTDLLSDRCRASALFLIPGRR